jgi:hypothetical protein
MQTFTFPPQDAIPSDWRRLNRKYTVKTEALGTAFSMSGYWLYEPSVILPCALTGNKYVLLINRNKNSGQGQDHGEVIVARTSDDPYNFGSETIILDMASVDNICDMIDARPIWDGSQWHIYIQAKVIGNCGDHAPNNIYEAIGSSLNPPAAFQWVKESGTNHAKALFTGDYPDGIGESLQWFNPSPYGIPDYPFMGIYNNWGCDALPLCGQAVFNYLSQDDDTYYYWYGPEHTPAFRPEPNPDDWGYALPFPDAILLGGLDVPRQGNPGIGFSSQCYTPDGYYGYCLGIGFFNNPANVPYTSLKTGYFFEGALESTSSDSNGPRMFSLRVARNEYGYIAPQSYHGYPRQWVTYVYYNPTQQRKSGEPACSVTTWKTTQSQSISVSRLTITELSSGRTS